MILSYRIVSQNAIAFSHKFQSVYFTLGLIGSLLLSCLWNFVTSYCKTVQGMMKLLTLAVRSYSFLTERSYESLMYLLLRSKLSYFISTEVYSVKLPGVGATLTYKYVTFLLLWTLHMRVFLQNVTELRILSTLLTMWHGESGWDVNVGKVTMHEVSSSSLASVFSLIINYPEICIRGNVFHPLPKVPSGSNQPL